MQTNVITQSPIFKNIHSNPSKEASKYFPYKTQHFRPNEYRRSRFAAIKKLNQQNNNQNQQQSLKEIPSLLKEEKHNPQHQKDTIIKGSLFNKSPFILQKNLNKNSEQPSLSQIKIIPSSFVQPAKSPQSKLYSLKKTAQSLSKNKQTLFRKTFCTSLHKANKNHSLELKFQEKRPPTCNFQTFRPATRIRKVSNIGQESNGNFLAKYEIIKQLGKGTYGTVYLAKVMRKMDERPNLFRTNLLSLSKMTSKQSKTQKRIWDKMVTPIGHQGQQIKQNIQMINKSQEINGDRVSKEDSCLLMQTISSSTKKDEFVINRSDHLIDVNNKEDSPSKFPRENQPANQAQKVQISHQDQLVAIKVYEKFKMNKDPAKFKNIRKEITIMQNLTHQGVIKLYQSVQSITKISLVVQFGGEMSLLDYLKKNYPLAQYKLKDFSRQLLKTLIYLHDKNIVHRDIKPQNILVKTNQTTNQQTLKLIDYGFSTLTNKTRKLNVICGTPNFMAPELLSSKQYFGQKADVWSYGVVAFVMAQGRHPFKSNQYQQLTRLANKGKFIFKKKHEPLFEQFISQILRVKSDQRPTAVQISKFKWLQQQ